MNGRLGLYLAVVVSLQAQSASAQVGRVVDEMSGSAVPLAEVLWITEGPTAEPVDRVAADLGGRFPVSSGWSGTGWVEVRSLGHRPLRLSRAEAEAAQWRFALEPDPLELESVVVSASGRSQRRSEISVPIVRVSEEEIAVSGANSAEALLAELPGLQSTPGAPVGSNIQIRGIGASRVLVLIDGQPAGGALLENRDLSRISLSGVERVEVVKGPLSSLYGSDALGGVINVITQAPPAGFRADARLLSGGGGRYEGEATAAGGSDFRYRVTGSWRQEDRVPGLDPTANAFSRVWDLRSTFRYALSERLRLRSDVSFLRERQRWPVGGGFTGFNDNRGITGWTEATFEGGGGEWTLRLFGQDYDHLYRSARGDAPIAGGTEERQQERLLKATAMYGVSGGGHMLDIGVEAAHRIIESPDKILEDRAADEQLDLFAQDAWTVGRATVSGGLRATLNDKWGNTVSPTLGVSVMPDSGLRLRGVVGRGFRAPSFKELAWDFANLGAGYTVQGTPDLVPESSWNGTAGFDWAPSASVSLGLEGYVNLIDNLIENAFVGNNPSGLLVYSPRNVSRARTRGLEANGSLRLGAWQLKAEYALLDAESLDDGLPLDRRARHTGRLRVGRTFPVLDGLQLHATAHATGEAPIMGIDDTGAAGVVGTQGRFVALDAQAALQLPLGLRLTLGVDNLLDARPEGWLSIMERRISVGVEAHEIF